MKIAKQPDKAEIYQPNLDEVPGWSSLSPKKQGELYEHTSHVGRYRQMRSLGEFGELVELTQVQQLLQGEEMKMGDYLRHIYPVNHQRTIFRKQQAFAELAVTIPNPILKRITNLGQDVISKFDRIAGAALGDIRNAMRGMPMLPVSSEKDTVKYLEELNGKLEDERKNRRNKAKAKGDGFAERKATNALVFYMNEAGLETSAQKRQFLARVVGWAMEAQAVSGTLSATRVPMPDSIVVRRGRPRIHPKKEAA